MKESLKNEQSVYDIPEAHQNLVMRRFEETREYPDRLLDWNKAKETMNNYLNKTVFEA